MVKLAAAVATRHPELADGLVGELRPNVERLLQRWAATLCDGLRLELCAEQYQNSRPRELGDSMYLYLGIESQLPSVAIRPAFERASAIAAPLGAALLSALRRLTWSYGLVLTPASIFDLTSNMRWYGEVTTKGYREALDHMGADEEEETEEDFRGPDSFFDDFPGMPRQFCVWGRHSDRLRDAEHYFAAAGRANSDWECRLLLALSAVQDFASCKDAPTVFTVRDECGEEWEQVEPIVFLPWEDNDQSGEWADDAMQYAWESGLGTEGVFSATVRFGGADHRADDSVWRTVVHTIERSSQHYQVLARLIDVLAEAQEKD